MGKTKTTTSRRAFLATATSAAGAMAFGLPGCGGRDGARVDAITPGCDETPENTEGPYYRDGAPFRNDLRGPGQPGTVLTVRGQVLGVDPEVSGCGTPLAGSLVDIWQADDAGEYDNATAEFRLRGRLYADADGKYEFVTVVPGRYELGPGQYRPSHIHVKVSAEGHLPLTTQLYFPEDPFNDTDPWFHEALVVEIDEAPAGGLDGRFTFVLASTEST